MNKAELIDAIAASADISKNIATEALNALIQTITTELKGGGDITLVGFGTFSVKERAARTGRNPRRAKRLPSPPLRCRASSQEKA